MINPFKVVIPARYAATRLPGKPLLEIAGKPLIQHVFESAQASQAGQVLIATDDTRIKTAAEAFGADVIMTSSEHRSGTDRIAEAVVKIGAPENMVIVNVQGDEYGLPPAIINQLAAVLHNNPDKPMATLCERVSNLDQLKNPGVVKVVVGGDNSALYFSRSSIPWFEGHEKSTLTDIPLSPFRHIGIYAYRAGFLGTYTSLPNCQIEECEKLEQLRALYYGYKIHVEEACTTTGMEVNTPEDLERARQLAEKQTGLTGKEIKD